MTAHSNGVGMNVNIRNPLSSGGGDAIDYLSEVSAYSHVISAFIGFDSAKITLSVPIYKIDEWISNGLGRDVKVSGPDGAKAWEGFVNELDIQYGTLRITRGPLLGICNLCYVIYAPVDATTDPPTVGDRTITTGASDTQSITRYGTIERVLSPGNMTQTEAEQVRDTYLKDNAEPETGKTISIGDPGNMSITLSCLGYGYWLDAYLYSNSGTTGYITASERIEAILDYEINGYISTTRFITSNGILVPDAEYDYPTGLNAIRSVVDLGDANDNRWVFGIYEGRVPRYEAIPTAYEYSYRISDKLQEIHHFSNDAVVPPWSVRPAKWLKVADLITGSPKYANIYADPRAVFAESVSFTAPTTISISHSKQSTLERKIAKISLGLGV